MQCGLTDQRLEMDGRTAGGSEDGRRVDEEGDAEGVERIMVDEMMVMVAEERWSLHEMCTSAGSCRRGWMIELHLAGGGSLNLTGRCTL